MVSSMDFQQSGDYFHLNENIDPRMIVKGSLEEQRWDEKGSGRSR